MARVHDEVNALQFTVTTEMSPEQFREAGQAAITAAKKSILQKVNETSVGHDSITYDIKGPGNLVSQMKFRVTWTPENERVHRVSLSVIDYITTRTTVMFIPITPKSAPALGSLRRFSDELRRQLVRP